MITKTTRSENTMNTIETERDINRRYDQAIERVDKERLEWNKKVRAMMAHLNTIPDCDFTAVLTAAYTLRDEQDHGDDRE